MACTWRVHGKCRKAWLPMRVILFCAAVAGVWGGRGNPALYRGADKSLTRPSSPFILFDGENISFDASLVIYK